MAGYRAIHIWVQRHYGKADHCDNDVNHKVSRYHWANLDGKYSKDIDTWKQMCPSCNLRYDAQRKRDAGLPTRKLKTHCIKGHELSEKTALIRTKGISQWRACRACNVMHQKNYISRRKEVLV